MDDYDYLHIIWYDGAWKGFCLGIIVSIGVIVIGVIYYLRF